MAKTTKRPPAGSVAEYLQALPDDQRTLLEKVRQTILAIIPEPEELISYQIPAYKYKGKAVIYFAAFKKHCSLVPVSKAMQVEFAQDLAPFHVAGFTVHFTPEHPLPATLIKKIVQERLRQNAQPRPPKSASASKSSSQKSPQLRALPLPKL